MDRQVLTLGKIKAIRPYRTRTEGTLKFAGLRLSPHCAGKIEQKAQREGISKGAAIAEILEGWIAQTRPPKARRQRAKPQR